MENELISFTESKAKTISSLDMVDIINTFRHQEGNYTKIRHKNFMTKCKKEDKILKSLEINGLNISPAEYTDKKGEKRPMLILSKNFALQMLNSESAYCRYKTIEYIDASEHKIMELEFNKLNSKVLALEEDRHKVEKLLESYNYMKCETYGKDTYVVNMLINAFKKCFVKDNILQYDNNNYYLLAEPVKEEIEKYGLRKTDSERFMQYLNCIYAKIKVKEIRYNRTVVVNCCVIPKYLIDWEVKDSIKRLE